MRATNTLYKYSLHAFKYAESCGKATRRRPTKKMVAAATIRGGVDMVLNALELYVRYNLFQSALFASDDQDQAGWESS